MYICIYNRGGDVFAAVEEQEKYRSMRGRGVGGENEGERE